MADIPIFHDGDSASSIRNYSLNPAINKLNDTYTKGEVDSKVSTNQIVHSVNGAKGDVTITAANIGAIGQTAADGRYLRIANINTDVTPSGIGALTKSIADTLYKGINWTPDLSNIDAYSKTYLDSEFAKKADKATTYTKTEVDTKLQNKANAASVYTRTYLDTEFNKYLPKTGHTALGDRVTALEAEETKQQQALTQHANDILALQQAGAGGSVVGITEAQADARYMKLTPLVQLDDVNGDGNPDGIVLSGTGGTAKIRIASAGDTALFEGGDPTSSNPQKIRVEGYNGEPLDSMNVNVKNGVFPTVNGQKLYGVGNKPTASELNVYSKTEADSKFAPLNGATFTADVVVHGAIYAQDFAVQKPNEIGFGIETGATTVTLNPIAANGNWDRTNQFKFDNTTKE